MGLCTAELDSSITMDEIIAFDRNSKRFRQNKKLKNNRGWEVKKDCSLIKTRLRSQFTFSISRA